MISKGILPTRKGLRIFQVVLRDATGMIEAAFPGQPFLDRSIDKGDVLLVSGPVRFFHGRQLVPREFVNLGEEDSGEASGRVLAGSGPEASRGQRASRRRNLDSLRSQVREQLLRDSGSPQLRAADALRAGIAHVAREPSEAAPLASTSVLRSVLHRPPTSGPRPRTAPLENRASTTGLREALPFVLTASQRTPSARSRGHCSNRHHRCSMRCRERNDLACSPRYWLMESGYHACLMGRRASGRTTRAIVARLLTR